MNAHSQNSFLQNSEIIIIYNKYTISWQLAKSYTYVL